MSGNYYLLQLPRQYWKLLRVSVALFRLRSPPDAEMRGDKVMKEEARGGLHRWGHRVYRGGLGSRGRCQGNPGAEWKGRGGRRGVRRPS